MAKITLANILSGFSLTRINDNFQKIEDTINESVFFKEVLPGEDNTLKTNLDMNGNKLFNLSTPTGDNHAARLKDVKNAVAGLAGTTANFINFEASTNVPADNVQGGIQYVGDVLALLKAKQALTNLDFIVDPVDKAAILAGTSTKDHTAAVQAAINAAGSKRRLYWLGVVNCKSLSSADSVDWVFENGAKIKQIAATYTAGSYHVSLTGPRVRLENVDMDGNQFAMAQGQGSNGLLVNGVSPVVITCKVHGYNGVGYTCNSSNVGVKHGVHIGCNFDDNAGLGLLTIAASYLNFLSTSFDRNGYGFQKTRSNYADISHGFVGFGLGVRMRSHHINFTNCTARDNGRDGFNVNQGSYAIKFSECLAHGNDDGGFTIAADNTGTGLPGEAEACYDIEYNGCEGYNNYTGGFVAYQACHNVSVFGGRFYNNHRIAGDQPTASSFFNGIFIAGGSTGIVLDTEAYDDRQSRVITSTANGVLQATDWVAGTKNFYPKVSIYSGTDMSWKGYASIVSEASGTVTITPTANNGVTLTAIAVGDYVSQALQHNGVFIDNNSQAEVSITGAGHRKGASGATGRLTYVGAFSYDQNVVFPNERQGQDELIPNPSFDVDISGWSTNFPGGGVITYHNGANKRSAGSMQMTGGSAQAEAVANMPLKYPAYMSWLDGEFCEFGVWAYGAGRGDSSIMLFWTVGGSTFSSRVVHPGGGWKYLRIGAFIPPGSTSVFPRLQAAPGKTVYYDTASLRTIDFKMSPREYSFPSRSLAL